MSGKHCELHPEAVREIERIVAAGNKSEVEFGRDGVKVIEVRREVAYAANKRP